MTRRGCARILLGLLVLVGVLGGCDGGDSRSGEARDDFCVLLAEREPNATVLNAQFLGDVFRDDCVDVAGSLFDAIDVDSYRVLIHQSLTLVVTLDHSPLVDFDVQLFDAETGELILDCGVNIVPEVCVVPFVVRTQDIVVDVVVTSFVGAGTYTLLLDAQ